MGLVNMMRKYWGTEIHWDGKPFYGRVHSHDCNNVIFHMITFIVWWLKIIHRKVVHFIVFPYVSMHGFSFPFPSPWRLQFLKHEFLKSGKVKEGKGPLPSLDAVIL